MGQIDNERNFHIFYQLTKAAPPEYQQTFGLQGPESFLYTSRSNCLDVPGINDIQDFEATLVKQNVFLIFFCRNLRILYLDRYGYYWLTKARTRRDI